MIKKLFLAKNILELKRGGCSPLAVDVWVTEKCNSKCVFCDFWKKGFPASLEFETFDRQLKASKVLKKIKFFGFTGGEPFLHTDLEDFVDSVIKHANPQQIRFASNGLAPGLVVGAIASICKRYPNTSVNIKLSVDGLEETHNRIRGVSNGFAKTMETLDLLNEFKFSNLSIGLGFTANTLNYREMNNVLELAKKKKTGFFYKPVVNTEVIKNDVDKSLFLNEDNVDFIKENVHGNILDYYSNLNFVDRLVHKKYLAFLETYYRDKKRKTPCFACSASFHIAANGNVFSCIQRPIVVGNLYEELFDDIWRGEKANRVRDVVKSSNCSCTCASEMFPNLVINTFPFKFLKQRAGK